MRFCALLSSSGNGQILLGTKKAWTSIIDYIHSFKALRIARFQQISQVHAKARTFTDLFLLETIFNFSG